MMLKNNQLLSTRINGLKEKDKTKKIQKEKLYQAQFLPESLTTPNRRLIRVWEQIELRPGLWISMLESPPNGTVSLQYQKDPAMIDFGFVLSGRINHRFENRKKSIEADKGFAGIGYFPGRKGVAEFSGENTLRVLHLHIRPELLYNMVLDDTGSMPSDFLHIIEGNINKTFLSRRTMDAITRTVVFEVFNRSSSVLPQKLYLEYRAMELLTLQISHLMSPENGGRWDVRLSTNEKTRIREARDILIKDLSDPPTLKDLCQNFSLSRNKLQFGFRVMFGKSVFGYFRDHKMQKACHLFKTTDMNVSEVAWETGYINVSQFTKAFKKRFGILPKQYRQSSFFPHC